jgi:hypothetical protein
VSVTRWREGAGVARPLDLDELVDHFMLVDDELELLRNKTGATRLGFGLVLKFLLWKGRFPRGPGELPDNAVEHVARQVGVPAEQVAFYDSSGRQAKRHRAEIRERLGFRECGVADAELLTEWLIAEVTQAERRPERVREELLARCRECRIEPPTSGRVDRIVRSALHRGEELLSARVTGRLAEPMRGRLLGLVAGAAEEDEVEPAEDGPSVLASIRSDAGDVSLNTMLTEIAKLEAVRAVGLPAGLFADVAPWVLAGWRARAAVEAPSHLRSHPEPVTLTLLAALLHCREREITDTLVELLISTVHRINARAEIRVTKELIKEFKRVTGKENLLFRLAKATVDAGDELVRDVVFPVAPQTVLRDLVAEFKSSARRISGR